MDREYYFCADDTFRAAEILIAAGAHPLMGRDCNNVAAAAVLRAVSERITGLLPVNQYEAERESWFRSAVIKGAMSLGDGMLLDATLRGSLGRGAADSPLGAWAWYAQRITDDGRAFMPCEHPPSWPGAALLLSAITSAVTFKMDEFYRPADYEPAPDPQPLREHTPRVIAWLWARTLPIVRGVAADTTWGRRRAAVCAVALAEEEDEDDE